MANCGARPLWARSPRNSTMKQGRKSNLRTDTNTTSHSDRRLPAGLSRFSAPRTLGLLPFRAFRSSQPTIVIFCIAAGRPVTPRPPHRCRRAQHPRRAPQSYSHRTGSRSKPFPLPSLLLAVKLASMDQPLNVVLIRPKLRLPPRAEPRPGGRGGPQDRGRW
jgi:hypothetical protein